MPFFYLMNRNKIVEVAIIKTYRNDAYISHCSACLGDVILRRLICCDIIIALSYFPFTNIHLIAYLNLISLIFRTRSRCRSKRRSKVPSLLDRGVYEPQAIRKKLVVLTFETLVQYCQKLYIYFCPVVSQIIELLRMS